MRYNTLCL